MRWGGPAPLFLEGLCTEASHDVVIVGRQDVQGTCMCHNSMGISMLSGRVVLGMHMLKKRNQRMHLRSSQICRCRS